MPSVANPPYRADHVGSLLRPQAVKDARKRFHEERAIDAEGLRAVEDEAIRDAVRLQENAGLPAATDGETIEFSTKAPGRAALRRKGDGGRHPPC